MLRKSAVISPDYLPQQVGDFSFVQMYEPGVSAQNYYFALYENSQREQAILKLWVKSLCSRRAKILLKKEIALSKSISKIVNNGERQFEYGGVGFPEFIASEITGGTIWMLSRFVVITEPTTDIAPLLYRNIQQFCQTLGESREVRRIGSRKSIIAFFAGFCFTALYSCVKYQPLRKFLFNLPFRYFVSGFCELFHFKQYQFCHLDIRPENVLTSGDQKYIIDFQFSAYTHPMFDLAYSYHRSNFSQPTERVFSGSLNTIILELNNREKSLLFMIFLYGICFDLTFDQEMSFEKNFAALCDLKKIL